MSFLKKLSFNLGVLIVLISCSNTSVCAQSWQVDRNVAHVNAMKTCRHYEAGKLEVVSSSLAVIKEWDAFGNFAFTEPGRPIIFEIDGVPFSTYATSRSSADLVIASITSEILSSLKRGNRLRITSEYSDEWMVFSLSGSSTALSAVGL